MSTKITDIIIEGTDGIGKSKTIESLEVLKPCYKFHDRNREVIANKMTKDTPMEECAKAYEKFILENPNVLTVLLFNDDGEELLRRVKTRDKLMTGSDLEAPLYNKLYKKYFEYMKENNMLHGRAIAINVTGMSLQKQINEIDKAIECFVAEA
jgi:thymidylate kinase